MNIVQVEEGCRLNPCATSRGELVSAARKLADEKGLSHVGVRDVAALCGVAVGSLYNYFPTKADLIAAVIEDFWRGVMRREHCAPQPQEPFPAYVERLYGELAQSLSAFQSDWLTQIAALGDAERRKGRTLEARCFAHIRQELQAAAERTVASSSPFAGRESELAEFVFRHMMALLRDGQPACAFLREVLERLLE